jgi:hypothetical protein
MWELRLPGHRDGDNPAVRRGIVIHEWLRMAHSRPSANPCVLSDLPEPGSSDIGLAGELMTSEEYREARPFLLGHLEVCPLQGPVTGIRAEPTVAAYDPVADVIVVAEPDLIRRVNGRLVYREQKTSARPFEPHGTDALRQIPQLALAVCLIAAGVFEDVSPNDVKPSSPVSGVVELEVVTPTDAEVFRFDVADPDVLAVARRVGFDHIQRHPQRDLPVHRPAAAGGLAAVVLDGDLIAEEPGRARSGVGDQRLVLGQFQLEFLMQERRQSPFDLLGFGLGSGEPEQMVICLCRGRGYADFGARCPGQGGDRVRVVGIIPRGRW